MQFPMRVEYAVRAVVELAAHQPDGLMRSADLAQRCRIPKPFLVQLLHRLRKAGIIRSVRGPSGGHALVDAPESLTLGQIVRAVGEPPFSIGCMIGDHCIVVEDCVLQDVWREIAAQYEGWLHEVSIAEVVRRAAERTARGVYSI